MNGKKAGIFAISMVVGMIIFISLSWYSFSITNKNLNLGISKAISANYQNTRDKIYFYTLESSKLAASQAFYEVAKESAVDKEKTLCTVIENKLIWNQNCKPEQKFVENKFLEKYNDSFIGFLKNYPEKQLEDSEYIYLIEEDELFSTTSEKTLTTIETTPVATYTMNYMFDSSLKINLFDEGIYLEDFESIYKQANSAITACKDSKNMVVCVKNRINLGRWVVEVEKEGSYLIFKCKTKKYFFFNESGEKFEQIGLDFAMSIF